MQLSRNYAFKKKIFPFHCNTMVEIVKVEREKRRGTAGIFFWGAYQGFFVASKLWTVTEVWNHRSDIHPLYPNKPSVGSAYNAKEGKLTQNSRYICFQDL